MSLVLPSTARLKKNYHQTFELKKNGRTIARHTLLVNPQEMSVSEPSRSNVTQTLGGSFVQDFGQGLPTVSISVITGYKARYNADGDLRDGYTEFKHFRDEIYRKYVSTNDPEMEMVWHDWENEEHYIIQPQPSGFRLQRSKSEPLMYRFEFQFTCLRNATTSKVPTNTVTGVNFLELVTQIALSVSGLGEAGARFGR